MCSAAGLVIIIIYLSLKSLIIYHPTLTKCALTYLHTDDAIKYVLMGIHKKDVGVCTLAHPAIRPWLSSLRISNAASPRQG